jgi:hypothetical protein
MSVHRAEASSLAKLEMIFSHLFGMLADGLRIMPE